MKVNASTAAALALVNGQRTLDEIVGELCPRVDGADARARNDVETLFDRLRMRRMIVFA
jgi:Coenzyme PQQ synthesis protein D (PqqD)